MRGLFAQGIFGDEKLLLEVEDSPAGAQAHAKLVRVERFRYVVVSARIHTLDEILLFGFGGKE